MTKNLITKEYGVVYVVFNYELNIVKIGITTEMPKRLLTLMYGCGCDLELLYTTPPVSDYSLLERKAHLNFDSYRRQYGEWFNMNGSDAIMYLSKVVDDKKIHPLCVMYKEGKSITDIASFYNVSRSYVIKLLKNWNLYKRDRTVIFKNEKSSRKEKLLSNEHIPAKYRRAAKFIRVSENVYKHEKDEVYKTKVFKNGKITETFFKTKEQAMSSLTKPE